MNDQQHNPGNPSVTPEEDRDAWRAVCDWLRDNGVDPATVPANPHASVHDGQLTLLRKVQRQGQHGPVDILNPQRTAVMTETITVPVVVPPPPLVATWLAPRCPACGR